MKIDHHFKVILSYSSRARDGGYFLTDLKFMYLPFAIMNSLFHLLIFFLMAVISGRIQQYSLRNNCKHRKSYKKFSSFKVLWNTQQFKVFSSFKVLDLSSATLYTCFWHFSKVGDQFSNWQSLLDSIINLFFLLYSLVS